jgi:hypothetical protein
MKTAILRGLFLFGAGAGCATAISQIAYPPPQTTLPELEAQANELLVKVADFGIYGAWIDENKIMVNLIACPPSPRPKYPAGAVDPYSLQRGLAMLNALETARLVNQKEPFVAVEKCRPYNGK